MLCLTHLAWVGRVGRMPAAMPVSIGMQVGISRVVV